MIDRFYKRFKEEVKDGINTFDQPKEFIIYIILAIKIDIRLYQRHIEKTRGGRRGVMTIYPRTN